MSLDNLRPGGWKKEDQVSHQEILEKLKKDPKSHYHQPMPPAEPTPLFSVDPKKMKKDWEKHTSEEGRPPIGGAQDN